MRVNRSELEAKMERGENIMRENGQNAEEIGQDA